MFSTHMITICTRFDISLSDMVKSDEDYPNRVASFGLNRSHMNIRTPNSCCTDNIWFFMDFCDKFVVFLNSGHFWEVYQSHYCASEGEFIFSCVYEMYLNFASLLYGKQIKSKLGKMLYLWMIVIYVPLISVICLSALPWFLTLQV